MQKEIQSKAYEIGENKNGDVVIKVRKHAYDKVFVLFCNYCQLYLKVSYLNEKKTFSPEQLSATMLTKLKEVAEAVLKFKVVDCVLSVSVVLIPPGECRLLLVLR